MDVNHASGHLSCPPRDHQPCPHQEGPPLFCLSDDEDFKRAEKNVKKLGWTWDLILGLLDKDGGEGNGSPLQYSCLENPRDGGAWWAAVHGVAKSWTRLSDFTVTFNFPALEKEMATHSSVLAWRIPGMGEPGGLQSLGLHRVGHEWSDLAAAAAAYILKNAKCYIFPFANFNYNCPRYDWMENLKSIIF